MLPDLFSFPCSVFLTTHSSHTCSIEVARIIRVHNCVDPHVLDILKTLTFGESIGAACHLLAHIIGLLAKKGITLASSTKIAALLAPENACIPPLKGFLASGVAHATVIVRSMGQSCRHCFFLFINLLIIFIS